MWRFVFAAVGLVSTAAILISAAIAIDGKGGRDDERLARAVAIEADALGVPDPAATGVIVARLGSEFYRLTPSGQVLGRSGAASGPTSTSVSGKWQAYRACPGGGTACELYVAEAKAGTDTKFLPVPLSGSVWDGTWSPAADVLAAIEEDGSLSLVDPVSLKATPLASDVTAYAWTPNGSLFYATFDSVTASLWEAAGTRVRLVTGLNAPVASFLPAPKGDQFAFLQDGDDGWQLALLGAPGSVRILATPGRLSSYAEPAPTAPASVAVSWSPDARYIAVSPATAPFVMQVFAVEGGLADTYYLNEGYAGEMKWSPDGRQLAVSTYSPDRKQHNVYLLESVGSKRLRFLKDGCLIFWSPDGRFLVHKREPHDLGIGAIRVEDGMSWTVSKIRMTPAAWGADEQTALKLAELPPRGVGGIGFK